MGNYINEIYFFYGRWVREEEREGGVTSPIYGDWLVIIIIIIILFIYGFGY